MFSNLVNGILRTANCYSGRYYKGVKKRVCRITPHYMEGYCTGKQCCEMFVPSSRRASANYCIGYMGDIWGCVDEENTAWTSGSRYNDSLAITIECACFTDKENYGVLPDATWNALVRLCVDICKRYGFRLNYTGDDSGNLTMHKFYDDTDCPGIWFSKQFDRLAKEVNKMLDGEQVSFKTIEAVPMVFGGVYECQVNGLRVRDAPSLTGKVVAHYYAGNEVQLDDWYTSSDGYIWGRYTGNVSGQPRYVAVGRDTGKVELDDFLIKK